MGNIVFKHPEYAWLLVVLAGLLGYYLLRLRDRRGSLRFSSLSLLPEAFAGSGLWRRDILFGLRWTALVLVVLALMQPQERNSLEEVTAEGIDIMLVLDISSSMRAMDFQPNRLEAAKKVAQDFVNQRPNDRIGLNVFARESFLQCPLTTDHQRLNEFIADVSIVNEKFDGTAIGMALAGGINRLLDSDAKSKVIVLLSDGSNNAGELDPITTSELAREFDIRVYTVGAGTKGRAPVQVRTPFGVQTRSMAVDIDEETLGKIAEVTQGKYFRATDEKMLAQVYDEISRLETTEYEVREYVQQAERFYWPLGIALLMLMLEVILSRTIFRSFP